MLSQKSNNICTSAYVKELKELGDEICQNSDGGNCHKTRRHGGLTWRILKQDEIF